MASPEKFSFIRTILQKIGLSTEAVDDVVDLISDFLSVKEAKPESVMEYPYYLRDYFLSNAEISFYHILRTISAERAMVLTKVSLGDIFFVKSDDASKFRIYTNKIDRKHIDFLLCNPKSMIPFLAIELDDKSHERKDRKERDEFIEHVFKAAKLPLLRVPVRHTYAVAEVASLLQPYIQSDLIRPLPADDNPQSSWASPKCNKCGSDMVLRSAKTGPNQGKKFWGCSNYPQCRNIQPFVE
ncbi:MAG: DUF2726 domain-containing protein [Anaerolineaceae bacterium]